MRLHSHRQRRSPRPGDSPSHSSSMSPALAVRQRRREVLSSLGMTVPVEDKTPLPSVATAKPAPRKPRRGYMHTRYPETDPDIKVTIPRRQHNHHHHDASSSASYRRTASAGRLGPSTTTTTTTTTTSTTPHNNGLSSPLVRPDIKDAAEDDLQLLWSLLPEDRKALAASSASTPDLPSSSAGPVFAPDPAREGLMASLINTQASAAVDLSASLPPARYPSTSAASASSSRPNSRPGTARRAPLSSPVKMSSSSGPGFHSPDFADTTAVSSPLLYGTDVSLEPDTATRDVLSKAFDMLGTTVREPGVGLFPPQMPPEPGFDHTHRDLSYLSDTAGHGLSTDPRVQADKVCLPDSRIPVEYRVKFYADEVPVLERHLEWRKEGMQWMRQVFPSSIPSGRRQAILLDRAMTQMLADHNVKRVENPGWTCTEAYAELEGILSNCMVEMVRQVASHCIERGSALARVWRNYDSLFRDYHAAAQKEMKHYRDECDRKLNAQLQLLAKQRQDMFSDLKAKIDSLKAMLDKKTAELAASRDELASLRQEMEYRNRALETQLAGLRAELAAEKEGRKKEVDALKDRLSKTKGELDAARAKAAADRKKMEDLLNRTLNELSAAKKELKDLKASGAGHNTKRSKMIGALAGAGMGFGAGGPGTQDQSTQAPDSKKKKLLKVAGLFKKKAPPSPTGFTKAFLKRLIRDIQQIYKDKILADSVDDSLDNKRQNMPAYVTDWFFNRYGKSLAKKSHEMKLKYQKAALFFKDNPYAVMFARLWQQGPDPLGEEVCDKYLLLLGAILDHCRGTLRFFSRDGFAVHLSVRALRTPIIKVFGKRFAASPACKALVDRLASVSKLVKKKGQVVDQEQALSIILDAYDAHLAHQRSTLEALFTACDTDGDGDLSLEEFTALMTQIREYTPPASEVLKLYNAALVEGSEHMTKETFVTSYLKLNLLETSTAKKLARVDGLDETWAPAKQWQWLKEEWRLVQTEAAGLCEACHDTDLKEGMRLRITNLGELLKSDEVPSDPADLNAAIIAFSMVLLDIETVEGLEDDDDDGASVVTGL